MPNGIVLCGCLRCNETAQPGNNHTIVCKEKSVYFLIQHGALRYIFYTLQILWGINGHTFYGSNFSINDVSILKPAQLL